MPPAKGRAPAALSPIGMPSAEMPKPAAMEKERCSQGSLKHAYVDFGMVFPGSHGNSRVTAPPSTTKASSAVGSLHFFHMQPCHPRSVGSPGSQLLWVLHKVPYNL